MSAAIGYYGGIVTDGLVLYMDAAKKDSYPGFGNSWSSVARGANFTGSLINSPTFSTNGGGSVQFDGLDDYVLMNPSAAPTGNEITVGVWNYGVTAKQSSIVYCVGSAERTISIHLPWTDNRVYWDCGSGSFGGEYDRINTAILSSNQWQNSWHYWAFTKNASTGIMRIYLDGALNTEGSLKTLTISPSTAFYIAARPPVYQTGFISNLHMYNRALSASEVLQNYNATRGRFGL